MTGTGTAILSSSTTIPTTTAGIWPTTPEPAPTSTSNISARANARGASLGGTAISGCALTIQAYCAISLGDGSQLQPSPLPQIISNLIEHHPATYIYLSFPRRFSDNRRFRCQVSSDLLQTRCCIVGGGPAGMMLGFLLARAGVEVLVLEKHGDFLRDFRGDTIHPSTLELLHELGLLEKFLQRPHDEVRQLTGWIGESHLRIADFTHLPTHCKFLAFMPQWDFLNFFAEEAKRYPSFRLLMNT